MLEQETDYKELAQSVYQLLPEKFINFLDKTEAKIKEALNSMYNTSLINEIINIEFIKIFADYKVEDALKKYRELRRIYKRNWMEPLKEEIDKKDNISKNNPRLLQLEAEMLFNLLKSSPEYISTNSDFKNISTVEDFMALRYEDIEKWRKNKDSLLIDFDFYNRKKPKTCSNAFVIDLIIEALNIIIFKFDGNVDGYLSKYPSDFSKYPIFNLLPTTVSKDEMEIVGNDLRYFDTHIFKDGLVESSLTISEDKSIIEKYNIDFLGKMLDAKDQMIAVYVFNLINASTLETNKIVFGLEDMISSISNVTRIRKQYKEDFIERLFKIFYTKNRIIIQDKETGKIAETFPVSYFADLHIYSNKKNETTVTVVPSNYYLTKYIDRQYTIFLGSKYNKKAIKPQALSILMIMQTERIKAHLNNKMEKTFSLEYFKTQLSLVNESPYRVFQVIEKNMSVLMSESTILESYHIDKTTKTVLIVFSKLDEIELKLYKVSPSENSETFIETKSL